MFSRSISKNHRETICADIGADNNIIDTRTLGRSSKSIAEITVENMEQPRSLYIAATLTNGDSAKLICFQEVTVDKELFIRHGRTLVLRNLTWLVT